MSNRPSTILPDPTSSPGSSIATFEQEKGNTKLRFDFRNEYLLVQLDDPDSSREVQYYYGYLQNNIGRVTDKSREHQVRMKGGLVVAAFLTIGGVMLVSQFFLVGALLFGLSSGYHFFQYRRNLRHYSVIEGNDEPLFVLMGENHDEIIDLLLDRRRAQIRDWYWKVENGNDLTTELGRTDALVRARIINDEEALDRNRLVSQILSDSKTRVH